MINNKKVLALIPARGGSKGISDKNIYMIHGKPLIAYTIEAARQSEYVDAVVVSTDSKKISDVACKYGAEVPFLRPDYLASDTAKSIDAVIHAIKTLKEMGRKYDYVMLLQATSPLRSAKDIDGAIKTFINCGERGLLSVSPVNDSPLLIRTMDQNGNLSRILNKDSTVRRQDMPTFLKVNGAIYINRIDQISSDTSLNDNEVGYVLEKKHSVDIDSYEDIALVEYYMGSQPGGN